ncbi:MAG: glycosyltransferase family 4 protein [Myxococcales bacterium]|nr:glycosyltransferase family 4 protein [Myxococcales bacterium]
MERQGAHLLKVGARNTGEHPRGRQGRTFFTLTRLPEILGALEAPLYHAVANFNLPLVRPGGKRLVLTIHDVIPELLPETVSFAYRWQFKLWLSRSLRLADRVICVSARTRGDVLSRFEVDPSRISVVHNGVDHVDSVPPPDPTGEAYLRSLALPERFVLYAGALDARKNVGALLEACVRLRDRGRPATLVLAGQRWFGSRPVELEVARLRAGGMDVRPIGYLDDAVFYALMRRAAVCAFPSRYEGFGLPPLEAMRLGVPVVCSDRGAMPEVCGEAPVYASPDAPEELASALDRLLSSPKERALRAAAGRERARNFSWETAAKQTLEVYRQALSARS